MAPQGAAILVIWTTAALAATGTTWNVPYDAPTVTDALAVVGPGDVIELDAGVHVAPASIGVDVTIRGAAPGAVLQGPMDTQGNVTFQDLTLDGGGARVLHVGALTVLERVAVTGGSAPLGGLVSVRSAGHLVATDSSFAGGVATDPADLGGGAILVNASGTAEITGGALTGNSSASDGGAITALGSLTLTDVLLEGNTATVSGGGVMVRDGGVASVLRTRFCGNDAGGDAGGIYFYFAAPSTVDNAVFLDNTAVDDGGGLRTRDADLTVRHATFAGNDAQDNGAAVAARTTGGSNAVIVSDSLLVASTGGATTASIDASANVALTLASNWFYGSPAGGDVFSGDPPTETGTVTGVDPQLAGYIQGDCSSDVTLLWTSTARNVGTDLDPLGDTADLGAYGGPLADPELWVDADTDLVPVMWDCADAEPLVFPDNPEVCDLLDNDCDGAADQGLPTQPSFVDADGDGHGDPATAIAACVGAPGYTTVGGDCDDGDPGRSPSTPEICDELDNDCDLDADEELPTSPWYADADADGFGDLYDVLDTCLPAPQGRVSDATDCDDTDGAVHPGATDVPGNALDEDCDGADATEPTTPTDTGTAPTDTGSTPGTPDTVPTGDMPPRQSTYDDEPPTTGCACDSSTRRPWSLLLLGLPLFVRRRFSPGRTRS